MSSKVERLRAELALAEAQEEFVAKKLAGTLTVEDKLALRALREEYRLTVRQPVENGAAVAAIGGKVDQ